jgi:hypothetical protein
MNPMTRIALLLCLIGLATTVAAAQAAEEFEQHAAHEHGHLRLQLALEKNVLHVDLIAPALNVLGFEHEPRTAAEKRKAEMAPPQLRDLPAPLRLPPEAGCRRTSGRILEAHDEDHEHQHEHEEHRDVTIHWTYQCARPEALTWAEAAVLSQLTGVERVDVDSILPGSQKSARVKRADERVRLR